MTAYDELERRLSDSVSARASRRSFAGSGLGRWWRERLGPAGLALAVCSALLVAVAAAPSQRSQQPSVRSAYADLDSPGIREATCLPCRSVGGRLHAPLRSESGRPLPAATREVLVRRGLPSVVWGVETRRLR